MKRIFKFHRKIKPNNENIISQERNLRFLIVYHTFNKSRPMGDPSVWYRVYNFAEQLTKKNVKCDIISEDEQVNVLSGLSLYDCVIFFRPRQSRELLEVIEKIKSLSIPCYASYDDLIFDPSSFKQSSTLKSLARIDLIHSRYRDWANAFQLFNNYICSTKHLEKKIYDLNTDTDINVKVIDNIIPNKLFSIKNNKDIKTKKIGYFGGGLSHKDDITSIEKQLTSYLTKTESRFYVPAPIYNSLSATLKSYSVPFERLEYKSMLRLCSEMDAVIAPLIVDENSKSKSAIKFTEAAMCGTPLVATYIEAYENFKDSELLYLVENNNWENSLSLAAEKKHDPNESIKVINALDLLVNRQIESLIESI